MVHDTFDWGLIESKIIPWYFNKTFFIHLNRECAVLQLICLKTAHLKHRDKQVPFNWQDGGEETSEGESDDGAEKEREDGKAGDHWVSF